MEKLYIIGVWMKEGKLTGARVIDIADTRTMYIGDKLPIRDFDVSTLTAAIDRGMVANIYKSRDGEIRGRHGTLTKYPCLTGDKSKVVVIGRRNYDTVDYITVDGTTHTCGILEMYRLAKEDRVANATVYVKQDKYILKGTGWKIKDDLTLAEILIDNK